ncbi:uncharacterized protein TERG_08906 [Trichophyton rubrum CBS 118892]|uniref:Uncharacterized protein n=1 Tax=Trichophyton rubrum (strain ATCC MYA-4607 / CBS 118892) TaxID=559305 RepID=F2STW8_TRIRC|nr:uncharacterized protein TERG_08906 [Trichophyton rubrum CBS 118892]EGD90207.1 hypothetical protein TERG_08906 [Trichophyton rubrum CBS 118892]KMQ42395.1 hypothetical protein HL42_6890 [Trichophyton rubrum]
MKLVVELESLKLKKRMKLELELKLKLEEKKKKKKRKGLKFPFAEFISPRLKSHAADSADNGSRRRLLGQRRQSLRQKEVGHSPASLNIIVIIVDGLDVGCMLGPTLELQERGAGKLESKP